jgi:hypothetical protein
VFAVVRRVVGASGGRGLLYPAAAAACFIAMPVVVNMAHEAKPHLPGAVLVLLAVLAAARFVETGGRRWWLAAGGLCGAAFGMVLSMMPVFAVLPVMTLLRPMRWGQRVRVTLLAVLVGGGVYAATNPFVWINQFSARGREVFQSNMRNSTGMYRVGRPVEGAVNVARLTADGMSPLLAVGGAVGAVALGVWAVRRRKDDSPEAVRRRAVGVLVAVPAVLVGVQSALIGAGKPGEFGRFLLVPDLFLAVEAVVAVATFGRGKWDRGIALTVLIPTVAVAGGAYLRGFVLDSREVTPRLVEAERLRQLQQSGRSTLAVTAEPAPYCLPPVDLFAWRIVKVPPGYGLEGSFAGERPADVFVRPLDASAADAHKPGLSLVYEAYDDTPISWAAKPFEVGSR